MRGWKLLSVALAGLLVVGLTACEEEVPTEAQQQVANFGKNTNPDGSYVGNGAPSGPHYNLNIIGVERGHENDNFNSQGHRIFVELGNGNGSHCDINLSQGSDFEVTDYNCLDTDGNADFTLPDPDPGANDGVLVYSVWARALGKPNGSADMSACYEDESNNNWCWVAGMQLDLNAHGNGNKFVDASRELLTVCVCANAGCTSWKDEAIFTNANYDYYWHYENDGLRLAQLRFYYVGTYTAGVTYPQTCREAHGADIY